MKNKITCAVHLRLKDRSSTKNLIQYINEGLKPLGVNLMILEDNQGYKFRCFPELSSGTFGRNDAKKVAEAAKAADIRIVPLFMCLGHQGWRYEKSNLLKAFPEFCETPEVEEGEKKPDTIAGKVINNTPDGNFYCHSWCASNDDVYKYVFPMMDEIAEDFGADAVHVGMDEVFSIAEDSCPRCVGKSRYELYARTVNILHDHIVKKKGMQMMMWADRLQKASDFGYDDWEGDALGIWRAVDMIPKDIILMPWHYGLNEKGFPGIEVFLEKGFSVLPACWRHLPNARLLWAEALKYSKSAKEKGYPGKLLGMTTTCWADATSKYLEKLLMCLKEKVQDEDEMDYIGVASSLIYMTKALKEYRL